MQNLISVKNKFNLNEHMKLTKNEVLSKIQFTSVLILNMIKMICDIYYHYISINRWMNMKLW